MSNRHYYGIQYAYGWSVANNGNRQDYIIGFHVKAERDAWVDRRATEHDTSGYREAITSAELGGHSAGGYYDWATDQDDIPDIAR